MGLIYTEGHLFYEKIGGQQKTLPFGVSKLIFVPPKDNDNIIEIKLYSYSPYEEIDYVIYLLNTPIELQVASNKSYLIAESLHHDKIISVNLYYEIMGVERR